MAVATRPSTAARVAVAVVAVAVVAALTLLGVYVTGGLLTNDFRLSMALTAGWFALAGAVCVVVARRSRRLRLPVMGAYVVTAAACGLYLASTTLVDKEVHERVAVAAPAAATRADGARRNVLLRAGAFESVAHGARGTARVIRLALGGRVLTLTGFDVAAGPDLRLRLAAGPAQAEGDVGGTVDLGVLKGNRGDQQYRIPPDVDVRRHRTVIVWCRAFSVLFARARTRAS
jgi:hypothetical protein